MFSRFWRTSEKSSFLLYLPSNLMPVLVLKPNKVGSANAHAFSMYVLVHFLKKYILGYTYFIIIIYQLPEAVSLGNAILGRWS